MHDASPEDRAEAGVADFIHGARWKLGAALIVLGVAVSYRASLPLWATETTGTVIGLGATPADPNMNRSINVRFTAPDGTLATTKTFETGDAHGKLHVGDAVALYVWPFPPYAASAKEIVVHAKRKWHVLLGIYLAVSALFLGFVYWKGRAGEREHISRASRRRG